MKAAGCSGFSAESIDSLPEEGVDLFTSGKCGYCNKAPICRFRDEKPSCREVQESSEKKPTGKLGHATVEAAPLPGELKVDWMLQGNIKFKKV